MQLSLGMATAVARGMTTVHQGCGDIYLFTGGAWPWKQLPCSRESQGLVLSHVPGCSVCLWKPCYFSVVIHRVLKQNGAVMSGVIEIIRIRHSYLSPDHLEGSEHFAQVASSPLSSQGAWSRQRQHWGVSNHPVPKTKCP